MSFLDPIPALVRIFIVFAVILAAIRKKVSLGNAFVGGAVVLGLTFGLHPAGILKSAFFSFLHPKTLSLSVVVTLILVLSHSMESVGQMERLLDRFRGLIRNPGVNVVIFPALIGLLPMPGGAIFSAPMVKTLGEKYALNGAQLSFANYWFRHIWEYWWPLYPGVLLITTFAAINLWTFVLFLFPMTLVALAGGYVVLKGNIRENSEKRFAEGRKNITPFIRELTPVLLVIVLGLAIGMALTPFFRFHGLTIAKETGLIAALIIAIFWVWHRNRMPKRDRWHIVFQPDLLRMFYMVSAILVFQGVLKDSEAVADVSRELIGWRIPIVPICMILPCLIGFVGGITIAFVGTAMPILITMIQGVGQADYMLAYMMLALISGFMGVLFSPLHLCLQLSNTYFQTSLIPVYRQLWMPCALLLGTGLGYFWLLHKILPM